MYTRTVLREDHDAVAHHLLRKSRIRSFIDQLGFTLHRSHKYFFDFFLFFLCRFRFCFDNSLFHFNRIQQIFFKIRLDDRNAWSVNNLNAFSFS